MRPAFAFIALLLFAMPSQAQAQNQQQPRPPATRPAVAPPPAAPAPAPRFWYSTSSADGGYTVDLPGKAVERSVQVKGANGLPVISHLQEVNLDGGSAYFGMVWTRLAVPPKNAADAEKMLMQVRDNTNKVLQGALMTTRPAKYGNFSGLEYVVESGPNATRSRYRSFIVGNRLVQQVYSGTTGSENSPDVRKFHESLKLTP